MFDVEVEEQFTVLFEDSISKEFNELFPDEAVYHPAVFKAACDVKHFYSLVGKPGKKPRKCLKCFTVFISQSAGNRICGNCAGPNSKVPLLATLVIKN